MNRETPGITPLLRSSTFSCSEDKEHWYSKHPPPIEGRNTVSKKLIDKGSNSACGSNYSPRDKAKFMVNSGNKGRYPVLCCAK